MGLLQKALETYETHETLVGTLKEEHQPLAPVAHVITGADMEITLNGQGQLMNITPLDKEKTIIPVTEDSAGRTSAPCAHPLCEQVGYLSGKDEKKYELYVEQLQRWADSSFSHPMLAPILTYVKGKTLLTDLAAHGMEKAGEKALVRWCVDGLGLEENRCWASQSLFQSFIRWYQNQREENGKENLCMVSGEMCVPAKQHPKGIIPMNGNAKLISANDTSNFTYRGRFTAEDQAVTVGYEASQKAHNALRWLAAEQGAQVVFGGRTFLCWNPRGKRVPHPAQPTMMRRPDTVTPTDYQRELQRTLDGWRVELPEKSGGVVIAAFDAATTGRLALTYYNELRESDFLQRLHDWDETCCWWGWNPATGQDDAVQSSALEHIISNAFGTQREGKKKNFYMATDDRVLRQQMQRLVACRVDRAKFPTDIEMALVARASDRLAFAPGVYRNLLNVTCGVIRKYYFDHKKEELSMTLEEDRADRSYQFGRLLAVLEKAERDTYDDNETREPNAVRLQSVYSRRPLNTANTIEKQLEKAYFPKLKPGTRTFYKNLISEIISKLPDCTEQELNRPLRDTYLLGYYLQRKALYTAKENKEEKKEEEK